VLSLWLLGSLGWWALVGLRLGHFRRLLRAARPAPADVQDQARRLARRLGLRRCPGAWFVPAVVSPMLLALGRSPRLLLPVALWGRLTAEQRDTVLAHELAHVRRGDPWVRRLELIVLGLYWWHPVAWWARRALQEAEEQCCDAWVVWALPEAAPDYAAALVETAAFLSRAGSALPAGASGTGHVPLLKRRLIMILRGTPPRCLSRPAFWLVLGLGAVLLPLTPLGARPDPPAPAPAPSPAETPRPDPLLSPKSPMNWTEHSAYLLGLREPAWRSACVSCHVDPHQPPPAPARSVDSFKQAHDEVIRLLEEVRRSRTSLQEMEARLQRALKRLENSQPSQPRRPAPSDAPTRPGTPSAPHDPARMQELEKKLDRLQKEMEDLRRELRPGGQGRAPVPPADRDQVCYARQGNVRIPIRLSPDRNVSEVFLYASNDRGVSYRLVDRARPTQPHFDFVAKDG
jgi:hypothetical protein